MLLLLFRCQLRNIHHAYVNIVTPIVGGWRWHGIWWIRWSPNRYWIWLRLWCCVLWRYVWLLTNRGKLIRINDWIIQRRRHRYHRKWQLIDIWVNLLAIKAPVIARSCALPNPSVTCSTFVATINTLWTRHDKCNTILWWCCVPVILFADGQNNVRSNVSERQLKSSFSFSIRNKIEDYLFVLI